MIERGVSFRRDSLNIETKHFRHVKRVELRYWSGTGAGGKMDSNVVLESVITCAECGQQAIEEMPTDFCLWFYECKSCHKMMKPKAGASGRPGF